MIEVTIPLRLPLTNELLRMHWSERGRELRRIAEMVWYALPVGQRGRKTPMARARIEITRYSSNEPDPDGLDGARKLLLDVLQPPSKRHPYGIGIIANDTTECVVATIKHATGKPKFPLTSFTIEELSRDDI